MKTIVYIDYNNTIEDIYIKRRGYKYFNAISRLAGLCDDNLEIYVITKANVTLEDDLTDLLSFMPENQRKFYKGLIKNGGETLTLINHKDGRFSFGKPIYMGGESKLDGVELSRKIIDKDNTANLFIFVGDDKDIDLPMVQATVKSKKYMILANNRHYIPHIENVIKTTKHSYGVANAINQICNEIREERDKEKGWSLFFILYTYSDNLKILLDISLKAVLYSSMLSSGTYILPNKLP